MALFGLFRAPKNAPAKKNTKKVIEKKVYDTTAGVVNTGVDVYSFPGTPEEYFAQVLARNFSGYEIRRNVDFAQLYDPSGAVRDSARTPGASFRTEFHRSVANDMLRGRYPRLTFVIYQNGQPEIAVLLSPKAAYKDTDMQLAVDRMGLALRQKNIAFQRYYKEFRNDEAYVRERIQEDLGW